MVNQRFFSILTLCASFFALGVIALGAFTRLIDAGLGCPDWPGCYGHIIVPSAAVDAHIVTYKAWAEMAHRYVVGGLSVFAVSIIAIIVSKKIFRTGSNMILAAFLFSLFIYQVLLGKWTVTLKLMPIVVTQHLLGGFLILSVLWLLYLNNLIFYSEKKENKVKNKNIIFFSSIALIILVGQIFLGAWTSTHYASLSCPDFPFCVNTQPMMALHLKEAFNLFVPTGVNYEGGVLTEAVRQTIQVMHRLGALVFTLYMLAFSAWAIPKLKQAPELIKALYLILGFLFIQLCVGISNIVFKLPLVSAIFHNLIAAILLLSIITFLFNLVKNGRIKRLH